MSLGYSGRHAASTRARLAACSTGTPEIVIKCGPLAAARQTRARLAVSLTLWADEDASPEAMREIAKKVRALGYTGAGRMRAGCARCSGIFGSNVTWSRGSCAARRLPYPRCYAERFPR